jgi:hypothetical protein
VSWFLPKDTPCLLAEPRHLFLVAVPSSGAKVAFLHFLKGHPLANGVLETPSRHMDDKPSGPTAKTFLTLEDLLLAIMEELFRG